jgi:hypothetical protein
MTDEGTGVATYVAYLQAVPRLSLTPAAAAAGSQVVATGDGFGAAETVSLSLDGATGRELGSTTSDAVGSLSGATTPTVAVPLTASIKVRFDPHHRLTRRE